VNNCGTEPDQQDACDLVCNEVEYNPLYSALYDLISKSFLSAAGKTERK
jgi:hypothetical protein